MYWLDSSNDVSSLPMTREQAIRKREKLAAKLSPAIGVLRGSLLQRTIRHSSGCLKCARGEGHLLWVLTVGYPGGKTRQVLGTKEAVAGKDLHPGDYVFGWDIPHGPYEYPDGCEVFTISPKGLEKKSSVPPCAPG